MASVMSKSVRGSVVRPSRAARTPARVVCAANRATWLPNLTPPSHLKGTLAGDSGFDPLGLGTNEARLKWYVEAEKTNGRWAMMAVVGILATEAMGLPKWYEHGLKEYDLPFQSQLGVLFPVMGFLETKRYQGFKETGTSGFINSFPFDPAGMNSAEMQVKEVKNGRLAMVAFAGFALQAVVTHTTPLEGLAKHLSDPLGRNITYYASHTAEVINGTA